MSEINSNSICKIREYRKKPIMIKACQWFPGANLDGVIENN